MFIKKAIVLGMILSLVMLFCGLTVAEEEKVITITGKVTSIDKELGLVFVDGIEYVADFDLGEFTVGDEVEIAYVVEDNKNILLDIAKVEKEAL